MSSLPDQLLISALAIVPHVLSLLAIAIPLYLYKRGPLLGSALKDGLVWSCSIVLFYGLSVLFMQIPLDLD